MAAFLAWRRPLLKIADSERMRRGTGGMLSKPGTTGFSWHTDMLGEDFADDVAEVSC